MPAVAPKNAIPAPNVGLKPDLLKTVTKAFARLGSHVVSMEAGEKARRTAGITYTELFLTFADSQQ